MPTELEVRFAKEIIDGFLQYDRDMEREELTYYCEFCDAESVTLWTHDVHDLYRRFKHQPDCIVVVAKGVMVNS